MQAGGVRPSAHPAWTDRRTAPPDKAGITTDVNQNELSALRQAQLRLCVLPPQPCFVAFLAQQVAAADAAASERPPPAAAVSWLPSRAWQWLVTAAAPPADRPGVRTEPAGSQDGGRVGGWAALKSAGVVSTQLVQAASPGLESCPSPLLDSARTPPPAELDGRSPKRTRQISAETAAHVPPSLDTQLSVGAREASEEAATVTNPRPRLSDIPLPCGPPPETNYHPAAALPVASVDGSAAAPPGTRCREPHQPYPETGLFSQPPADAASRTGVGESVCRAKGGAEAGREVGDPDDASLAGAGARSVPQTLSTVPAVVPGTLGSRPPHPSDTQASRAPESPPLSQDSSQESQATKPASAEPCLPPEPQRAAVTAAWPCGSQGSQSADAASSSASTPRRRGRKRKSRNVAPLSDPGAPFDTAILKTIGERIKERSQTLDGGLSPALTASPPPAGDGGTSAAETKQLTSPCRVAVEVLTPQSVKRLCRTHGVKLDPTDSRRARLKFSLRVLKDRVRRILLPGRRRQTSGSGAGPVLQRPEKSDRPSQPSQPPAAASRAQAKRPPSPASRKAGSGSPRQPAPSILSSSDCSKPKRTHDKHPKGLIRNVKTSISEACRKGRLVNKAPGDSAGAAQRTTLSQSVSREAAELSSGGAARPGSSSSSSGGSDPVDGEAGMAAILKRLTARTLRGDFKIPKRRPDADPSPSPPSADSLETTGVAGDCTSKQSVAEMRATPAATPAAVAAADRPETFDQNTEPRVSPTPAEGAPRLDYNGAVPETSDKQQLTAALTTSEQRTLTLPAKETSGGLAPGPANATVRARTVVFEPRKPHSERPKVSGTDSGGRTPSPASMTITVQGEPNPAPTLADEPAAGQPSSSRASEADADEIAVIQNEDAASEAASDEVAVLDGGQAARGRRGPDPAPEPARGPYKFVEFVSDDPTENADNSSAEWEVMRRLTSDSERYRFVRERWRNTDIPDPHCCLTHFGYRAGLVRANLERLGLLQGPVRGLKRALSSSSVGRPAGKRARLTAGCSFVLDWLLAQGRSMRTAGRLLPSLELRWRQMEAEAVRFCQQLALNFMLTPAQRSWELQNLQTFQQQQLEAEFGTRARRAAERLRRVKAETETFFKFYTNLKNTAAENALFLTEQQRQEVEDFENYIEGMDTVYGKCLDADL